MDKKERREIQNRLSEKAIAEFRNSLPINENIFPQLFNFLDIELGYKGCDHTTILTKTFLDNNSVSNASVVIDWLANNGGFCDCEVLANVEDQFEYLNQTIKKPFISNQNKKQKLNSLKTDFGFSIEKIPSPWTLTEVISGKNKFYNFQIGKNSNCIVNLELNFPLIQFVNDKFWIDLWVKETELDHNLSEMVVERFELENYSSILVKTKNWTPVKIWCLYKENNEWFLKMTTELSRYKGDIKELEKLISCILPK